MLAFTPLAGAGATGLAMFQEFDGDICWVSFSCYMLPDGVETDGVEGSL